MTKLPEILSEGRRVLIAAVSLAGVCQAVTIGVAAFAMRDVFAVLHSSGPLPIRALATLACAGIVVAALRVFGRTQAERLGQSFAISLRQTLYRHLAHQSRSAVSTRRVGALGLRFVGDLSAVRGWIGLGLTRIVSACVVLPGAALTLYLLNPNLAAAAILPLAATLMTMALLAVFVGPLHRELRSKRARIAISMMERVGIAPELDAMGRTAQELKALNRQGERLIGMATRRIRVVSMLRTVPEIGVGFAAAAILWSAYRFGAPAAEAAAGLAVLGILTNPLRELAGVWDKFCGWRIARAKCEAVLSAPSRTRAVMDRPGPVDIIFEGVGFREMTVDFSISAGETVLISGNAATGKTTVLNLAAGLEVPDDGTIRYGPGPKLPRSLSIAPNAPILQGSLRRALSLGARRRMSDQIIDDAARKFGFGSVLDRLGGLSARIGEGGRALSEGEKLRLHLTRAFLTEPNLLLVDAPLIAIDETLKEGLRTLLKRLDATVLIASHTEATFDFVDRHMHISEEGAKLRVCADVTAPIASAA